MTAVTAACGSSSIDEPLPPGPLAFINDVPAGTELRAANGALIRTLRTNASRCSPDATQLITSTSAGAVTFVFISDIEGRTVRQIEVPVANAQLSPRAVTWSPDAIRLAVSYLQAPTGGIFLMNANGSGATQLPNAVPGSPSLSWSPDGTELLFGGAGPGSTLRAVTIASGATRDIATNVFEARWSPDGNYIGIVDWFTPGKWEWPISVVNRDGTGHRLVTTVVGTAPSFTWTADGRMLYGDNGTLTFLNVNNGSKTPLTVSGSEFRSAPHWCGTP